MFWIYSSDSVLFPACLHQNYTGILRDSLLFFDQSTADRIVTDHGPIVMDSVSRPPRVLLQFSKAQHVTICPAAYLRVEDALRMIVFRIGQLIAFAVEDESGALEVSDQRFFSVLWYEGECRQLSKVAAPH